MIPHPQGWESTFVDDAEVLLPPGGPRDGLIRYLERLAPVRSVGELLEEQLAADPDFEVTAVSPVRQLVTAEGEYAALVTVHGAAAGAPLQRDIGYVFLDETYARIGGVARRRELWPTFTATVEHLAIHCSQMLGARRRRFRYAPPAGWEALHVGLRSEWLAPGFPDDPGCISVWPAMPLALGGATFAAQLGRGAEGPFAERSHAGLNGERWSRVRRMRDGSLARRELVVFRDERYVYPLRRDASGDQHLATFAEVLRTVEALPAPRAQTRTASDARLEILGLWN